MGTVTNFQAYRKGQFRIPKESEKVRGNHQLLVVKKSISQDTK
jgi:hypothetical protein